MTSFGSPELWHGKAAGVSACDFGFHMGVTRFDEKSERQLAQIVSRGVTSFKVSRDVSGRVYKEE